MSLSLEPHTPVPLGNIPGKGIPQDILDMENRYGGLFCIVAGALVLVRPNLKPITIAAEDGSMYIEFVLWVSEHPDRVHATIEPAVAFVRERIAN